MKRIVLVDDDFAVEPLIDSLQADGYEVSRLNNANDAVTQMATLATADLVILDVMMECPEGMSVTAAHGGHRTGAVLLRELRKRSTTVPVIVFSATQDAVLIEELRTSSATWFVSKLSVPSQKEFLSRIADILNCPKPHAGHPHAFIVHGHDDAMKLQLKNYLQNVMQWPEPVILHEQSSFGRTIIEKFEGLASRADIVFVLLTPDDAVAPNSVPEEQKHRSRQNVIFELGYFLGVLGRSSGRVLLLHKGPLELPSNIAGMVYIDISHGIEAAGESIRRETLNVR